MADDSRLDLVSTPRFSVFHARGDGLRSAGFAKISRKGNQNEQHRKQQQQSKNINNNDAVPLNEEPPSRSRERSPELHFPACPATNKLYMHDTYLISAEATVLGVIEDDKQGYAVVLDRTIFHPQGGGQPSDTGTITCESCTINVKMVRDARGVVNHFGDSSGSCWPQKGERAILSVNGEKRLRHAALHSAGHAVDTAMVAAAGAGVFAPLKGYHFEDSPHVEYLGTLPDGLDKEVLVQKLNRKLNEVVAADMETKVEFLTEEPKEVSGTPFADGEMEDGIDRKATRARGVGGEDNTAGSYRGGAMRIVTVAGLPCPCGGTHVSSTRKLEGVRVTKVKAKKGTLRVSYTLPVSQ